LAIKRLYFGILLELMLLQQNLQLKECKSDLEFRADELKEGDRFLEFIENVCVKIISEIVKQPSN